MTERSFLQRCCRILVNVIVLVSLAWFLVFGFFTQLSMSGHSMEPCLYSGDTVMLDTLSYHFVKPGRMDVVAFQRSDGNVTAKRVVGLPGKPSLSRMDIFTSTASCWKQTRSVKSASADWRRIPSPCCRMSIF